MNFIARDDERQFGYRSKLFWELSVCAISAGEKTSG